ncbi:hypothetical protein L7F22_016268 [Adiantum nelumboides]|nr:hypothetical protein [Adiantum nelumboides]
MRLSPLLKKFIHKAQSGFISGISIFHKILSVQLDIEHAQRSSQDIVMLRVDYDKAFDTVQWDFIAGVLQKMGFGPRIVNCIFMLGKDAWSRLLVNGRMSNKIFIGQSIREGYPFSPLLIAIATHPFFPYLESLAEKQVV